MEKNTTTIMHSFDAQRPLAVLIDFSNLMYRNYHALRAQDEAVQRDARYRSQAEKQEYVVPKPRFSAPDGTPTGALLLSLNKIDTIIKKLNPQVVALVLEGGGKQERIKLYSEYKANRKPADDGLKRQMQLAEEICSALGIAVLKAPQREADDVLVGAAKKLEELGYNTVLGTGDKDMYQAIGPATGILPLDFKDVVIEGVSHCEKKFGVPPHLVVDFLALVGDQSDGIPGVPGVGPVSAAKWLKEYGNVEAILKKAKEGWLPVKIATKILEHENTLLVSKQLASALPLEEGWDEGWTAARKDLAEAKRILEKLNMQSFLKKVGSYETRHWEAPSVEVSVKRDLRF